MQWQVALNNDSFDRAGITKDCQDAVCEYIWNSFEAGASKVAVSMMGSPLQEAMSLVVADNGMGIAFDNLDKTFGTFLSSLKNNATMRLKSQSNKGKGRFSYLSSYSHPSKPISLFTSFLCDAVTSKTIIRKGKKSLNDIHKLLFLFFETWEKNNTSCVQTPIYRANIGGTIYFDVEDYTPYLPKEFSSLL